MTTISRLGFMFLLLSSLAFVGCGDDPKGAGKTASDGTAENDHGHDHPEEGPHGGDIIELGAHKGHLEVLTDQEAKTLTVYTLDAEFKPIEIKDAPFFNMMADGKPTQLVSKRMADRSGWTFTHDALADEPESGRFRIVMGGATYTPEFAQDHDHDHGHDDAHSHGPNDGKLSTFTGGDAKGTIELKLHDDKGDLELWLTAEGEAFDLPLDTKITVTFTDRDSKVVTLQARNMDKNEDEDGEPTVRDGKTNYFIFPGDTGEDAKWLQGKKFSAQVVVTFAKGGQAMTSPTFELKPHTH